MKKLLIPIFIIILSLMGNNSYGQTFGGGDGSVGTPYLISTKDHLIELANRVNGNGFILNQFSGKYFRVTTDIDMSVSGTFNPIGIINTTGNNRRRPFSGNFNGNGHVISNLTIGSGDYVGLFGYISGAKIENLGIEEFTLISNRYGAGLVAYALNSKINSSYSIGKLTSRNNDSRDEYPEIGGLIGHLNQSSINNCYARTEIYDVTRNSRSSFGGLVAQIEPSNISTINNCYAASSPIPSRGDRGSLLGYVRNTYNVEITDCYFLSLSDMNNNYGGTEKSALEMQSGCFPVTLNNNQTSVIWYKAKSEINAGYPVLSWQKFINTTINAGFEGNCLGVSYQGGGESNQYKVKYVKDLIYISNMVRNDTNYSNRYFQVQNNISYNISGTDSSIYFNSIGDSNNNCFSGNFDGNKKIISKLIISENDSVGLFGCISGATIKNLGIANSCSFTSKINGGSLVGYASSSTINECYSLATLIGNGANSTIGGLVGYAKGTSINNSYSRNAITNSATGSSSGGLVCSIIDNSTISNSYSSPSSFPTTGTRGILVGSITNCTNPNSNSYYDISNYISGITTLGTSKTLDEMRLLPFAMDLNACQTGIWKWTNGNNTINNGLPILGWESGGTALPLCGSLDYPFRIRCVADLVTLSNNVAGGNTFTGSNFIVENNIDFSTDITGNSSDFNPIGNSSYSFQGNFNGNGHVISNLTIGSGDIVGLFGYISGARIDNLGIEGFNITTNSSQGNGGALVGYANNSEISGCYSTNSLVTGNRQRLYDIYIGGLVGYLNGTSKINNSYSRSSLEASRGNTYIFGTYISYVGGLVAYTSSGSTISNSYSAPESLGSRGTIGAFYADGSVTTVNSYYDNAYTNSNNNDLTSKSQAEMRSGCFPVTLNGLQSSIFWYKAKSESVSGITDGVNKGYPVLSWQTFTLSGVTTPAGFEGNCLGYDNPFVGDINHKYQVDEIKDLIYISNMVTNDTTYNKNGDIKYFIMLNDISFNDCTNDYSNLFNPIGISGKPFSGNFDGDRKAIANYKFSDATKDNIGLFGYIKNAKIKNLGISNFNISAKDNVGGLVGLVEGLNTIDACFVYGHIKGGTNVGGLVGNEIAGTGTNINTISNSFTNVTIDAQTNVGGIVGQHRGTITNAYSNTEIYSSNTPNNYVGGIIGLANTGSTISNVYSASKIIRNGTSTNFGKVRGNNVGTNINVYSRDNTFVNCDNVTLSGYDGTSKTNAELRNSTFVTTLNIGLTPPLWQNDYSNNINDGYPIFTYQPQAIAPTSGLWPTTTASQVVIIKNGVQIGANETHCPKCAYVKIEKGGELNNTTNLDLFGEYNKELFVGKWNLIGLISDNKGLASLYNYTDIQYKTFVKKFDYATNNWAINPISSINTEIVAGEGILVMPNYSLDDQLLSTSRIVSKGILYNEDNYTVPNLATRSEKFVSLANNYPASIYVDNIITDNSTLIGERTVESIRAKIIYVYDTDNLKWNNNIQSVEGITTIKPSEGFFIVAREPGGSFVFNKAQMNIPSGAKNEIMSDLIYIKAIANNETREAFLEFNDDANNGFDFNDGIMLFGSNNNAVEPYLSQTNNPLNNSTNEETPQLIKDAFSSLPYSTELDLRSMKENDLRLSFSNIPSDLNVYLIDSLLKKAQLLNDMPEYDLVVETGDNKGRLFILFSNDKIDINEFFKPETSETIRLWNYNNSLNIEGRDLIRFEIYDVMGNKVLEEVISGNSYNTELDLNNGIYIVRAYSKTGSKTEKLKISN